MRQVNCKSSVIPSRTIVLAGLFALIGSLPLLAGPPASRLGERLESGRTFALPSSIQCLLASAVDQGEAEASLPLPRITMHFKMTDAQQADLDRLVQAQQDPSSPQYHKWLTPEQFAERFGLSQNDLDQITGWLRRMGFTGIRPARGRAFVEMDGTASQVRTAFRTAIHCYRVDGELHYANASDPVLPKALEGVVSGIRGLNDFYPQPSGIRSSAQPRFTSNLTGNHYLAPGDFAIIYDVQPLYDAGIDGTGQTIAIAGASDIQLSDIEAFQAASGLPIKYPQIVLDGPDPGTDASREREADLDIEWSGAVARGATIIYVNSTDAFTSAEYAIDQNVAPILSISYATCESAARTDEITPMNPVFEQANAQGMTVVAASGDRGAAGCDFYVSGTTQAPTAATHGLAVVFPASSPYVTGAGGTEFQDTEINWSASNNSNGGSALGYISEMAWNDTAIQGALWASGGGASTLFAKPSWQMGAGVPADGARDVPDIAFSASAVHDGYLTCSAGWCTNGFRDAESYFDLGGGTSAATPVFAGIVALINQETGDSQGNINPTLYTLAATVPGVFHDVTTGSNIVPCVAGTPDCTTGSFGYYAGPGYDQVTGLGSVDAYSLVKFIDALDTPVTLNANGEFFSQLQGLGTISVTPAAGGSWAAWTPDNWITITGPSSGTGNGTVSFTIPAYTDIPDIGTRTGTIFINGQAFTVTQEGNFAAGLSAAGSMAQIASGSGWDTTLTLINLQTYSQDVRIDFYGNDGSPLLLPLTSFQETFAGTMLGATLDQTINPYAQLILDMAGSSSGPPSTGWAKVSTGSTVNGFAIFKSNGQEAVVPLETRNALSCLLAFDNTGELGTGLAVANLATAVANVNVIIRNDTGTQIGTGTVNLPAQGHNSFMLTDSQFGFPVTANKRGTIEFDTPLGGQISVLGLRANGGAITTLPVFANVGTGGGTLAHVASGGGWQTLVALVNTGTSSAQAQVNFFDEQGNPMTLPLLFP
ncbi:MAG: protease pro-enzyme activation domain-containing protein [Bryobacteraceae bacterium]